MRQVNFRLPGPPIAVRQVKFLGAIAEPVIEFVVTVKDIPPAANDEVIPKQ